MHSYVIKYVVYDHPRARRHRQLEELMINADSLGEALSQFKRDYPSCKVEDFGGDDVLVCADCEYKDSASCFDTVSGTVCPKCGSHHVHGTT